MTSAEPRMRHFSALSRLAQIQAINRLAMEGMSTTTIATATGLSVEMVRKVMAAQHPASNHQIAVRY